MIYRKKLYIVLLTLVSAFIMLGCSDDNETPVITDDTIPTDEVVETTYKTNPRAFALKFHDFIGDGSENIKRLDKDTVRIEINEGLLTYLNISELKEGDVLNIWENIDCPPYIRVVNAVERTSSGYIVTTQAGSIANLFESLQGCFDTELFSDISDRPERNFSRSDAENDYHYVNDEEDFKQFVDDEGKIHPFIIYTQDEENPHEYNYELAEKEYDEMTDSILVSRLASWGKTWHLINLKKDKINIYPTKDKDGLPFGVFVADASLAAQANLEIYFQLNVFESNRFWAKLDGNLSIDAPIHFRFAGIQLKEEKAFPIFEFTPICSAFALGPFVVPVIFRNGFVFKCSGAINGNLSMMLPFHYDASFQAGPKYENGNWSSFNHFDWHAGINYDKLTALPSANLSLTGTTGFYLRTGAYFGDAIGPFLEVGPQAKVSANAGITGKQVLFNTKGTVGIGGNVGAEIKIWKFNFGKNGIPFWIKSKELWDLDLRFSTDDIINAKPK